MLSISWVIIWLIAVSQVLMRVLLMKLMPLFGQLPAFVLASAAAQVIYYSNEIMFL